MSAGHLSSGGRIYFERCVFTELIVIEILQSGLRWCITFFPQFLILILISINVWCKLKYSVSAVEIIL